MIPAPVSTLTRATSTTARDIVTEDAPTTSTPVFTRDAIASARPAVLTAKEDTRTNGMLAPPRITPVAARTAVRVVTGTTLNDAMIALDGALQRNGKQVIPGRLYVVQVDRAHRDRSDLNKLRGRTYVLRGNTDGTVTALGAFYSSSQPTIDGSGEKVFPATRSHGAAYIDPGMYTVPAKPDASYKEYGGSFRIRSPLGAGIVPAARDANRDGVITPNEENGVRATGVLIHSSVLGSSACQIIYGFDAFRDLVAGEGTFDYVLERF